MRTKFYIFLLFIMIFASCREQKRSTDKSLPEKDTATLIDTSVKIADTNKLDTKQLLSLFFRQRVEVEKKLVTASKAEANALYDAYFEASQPIISKLTESEADVLEKFYNEDIPTQNRVKKEAETLSKYDLAFDEIGEGIVEIKTKNDYYYNIFKNYVTDDYKAYLAIKKEEDKVQYAADASLSISFKEIGKRIIVWEKLMEKYPKTTLLNKIKEIHQGYQTDYLFGLDNTATREFPDSEKAYIYPENIAEFNSFIKNQPQSPTTKLIRFFLKNFKDKNIRNLIDAEQQKTETKLSGLPAIGEKIEGDFNGDGNTDVATAIKIKNGQGNPVESGTADEYEIRFSDNQLLPIKSGCCAMRLINEGDLNNDGAAEISVFQAPVNGCTYSMTTYSFKNSTWTIAVKTFLIPTGCEKISDADLQKRIFVAQGAVYYYDTDPNENSKLVKRKAIIK